MVLKSCGDGRHIFARSKPDFGESCKCGKMGWGVPEIEHRLAPVVSLNKFRNKKKCDTELTTYKVKLLAMDKLQLLEEMVRYQEWRGREGKLTSEMMLKGLILFELLEKSAETSELRLLTRSYRRHLQYELDNKKDLPPIA